MKYRCGENMRNITENEETAKNKTPEGRDMETYIFCTKQAFEGENFSNAKKNLEKKTSNGNRSRRNAENSHREEGRRRPLKKKRRKGIIVFAHTFNCRNQPRKKGTKTPSKDSEADFLSRQGKEEGIPAGDGGGSGGDRNLSLGIDD